MHDAPLRGEYESCKKFVARLLEPVNPSCRGRRYAPTEGCCHVLENEIDRARCRIAHITCRLCFGHCVSVSALTRWIDVEREPDRICRANYCSVGPGDITDDP